jgi:hypothetical protein
MSKIAWRWIIGVFIFTLVVTSALWAVLDKGSNAIKYAYIPKEIVTTTDTVTVPEIVDRDIEIASPPISSIVTLPPITKTTIRTVTSVPVTTTLITSTNYTLTTTYQPTVTETTIQVVTATPPPMSTTLTDTVTTTLPPLTTTKTVTPPCTPTTTNCRGGCDGK